jgi:hypothetical protein
MARYIGKQPLRRDVKEAFEKNITNTAETFDKLISSGYEYGDLMAAVCKLSGTERDDWKREVRSYYEEPYRDLIKSLLQCCLLRKDTSGKLNPMKIVFEWPDANASKEVVVTFTNSGHCRVKIFGFSSPHTA